MKNRVVWRDAPQCEDLGPRLAAAVDDTIPLTRPQRRHAESCLRCQAEMAQHRKLLRALQAMGNDVMEPAPNLVSVILAGLPETDEQQHAIRSLVSDRRAAYLGGLAAATAAGAVSAIVVATRTRRARLVG